MTYADTSSLLKLFILEPESAPTREVVATTDCIVVSPLAVLECEGQFRAMRLSGEVRASQAKQAAKLMERLFSADPFRIRALTGAVFEAALRQHRAHPSPHCRALDRLHLAAMEELGIHRLMTHDRAQADAARVLGFEVIMPGRATPG